MGGTNSKSGARAKSNGRIPKSNETSPTRRRRSRKDNKSSPEHRPRRRASQTYFFKYQLAKNPLKAEEEDLRLALLASLQQCANGSEQNGKQSCSKDVESDSVKLNGKPTRSKRKDRQAVNGRKQRSRRTLKTQAKIRPYLVESAPDEVAKPAEPLKKPDTEDFLSFICFRSLSKANDTDSDANDTAITSVNNGPTVTRITYPLPKLSNSNPASGCSSIMPIKPNRLDLDNEFTNETATRSKPEVNGKQTPCNDTDNNGTNNRRRPTRQSPRLAGSTKKISENSNTACNEPLTYEEDMERAFLALQDMAHETAQSSINFFPRITSPYKNSKHLVRGLMTREFAGAFADEETIFNSISNHNL